MQVHDVMTEPPQTCPHTMRLANASRRMRETGCGSLIVLGPRGRIVGIATDRDLALALGQDCAPGRLSVDRVMSRPVHTCRPEDDVRVALERMVSARVRRLPVVAEDGDVKGLISIDDIVLWGLQSSGVGMHALIAALRALCAASGFPARDYADENFHS
jgi:CBS domain-containing protein